MADLVVEIVEGQQAGWQMPLEAPIEAGRDQAAALPLTDTQVSRHHLRLQPWGQGAWVEDLGSTNGTYVNDQPLQAPREIAAGRPRADRADRAPAPHGRAGLRAALGGARGPACRRASATTCSSRFPRSSSRPPRSPRTHRRSSSRRPSRPSCPATQQDDEEARADYAALPALVDTRVKHQTTVASFAFLAVAGLAVLIFFGVR